MIRHHSEIISSKFLSFVENIMHVEEYNNKIEFEIFSNWAHDILNEIKVTNNSKLILNLLMSREEYLI
jgi:hypothetical protein